MATTPKPKGKFADFLAVPGKAAATADMPVRREEAPATPVQAAIPEKAPTEPKVGLNLKVDQGFKDLVEGLSYRHRRPMVSIVKEAIDLWIDKHGMGER